MSFLDSLENNLKSLENRDEREAGQEQRQRESAKARAQAVAPWAEQLRNSDFTKQLLSEATRTGHRLRRKINLVWIGNALRLESREHRLELQPTPDGIDAVFLQDGAERHRATVDLDRPATALLDEWTATFL